VAANAGAAPSQVSLLTTANEGSFIALSLGAPEACV
jgi:hypothetical protein